MRSLYLLPLFSLNPPAQRLVVKMSATTTRNAGTSAVSMPVKLPAHPTYNLKSVIQLAQSEDAGDLVFCQQQVETRTLDEVNQVLHYASTTKTSLTIIMLDNMVVPLSNGDVDISMLKEAVKLIEGRFETEGNSRQSLGRRSCLPLYCAVWADRLLSELLYLVENDTPVGNKHLELSHLRLLTRLDSQGSPTFLAVPKCILLKRLIYP